MIIFLKVSVGSGPDSGPGRGIRVEFGSGYSFAGSVRVRALEKEPVRFRVQKFVPVQDSTLTVEIKKSKSIVYLLWLLSKFYQLFVSYNQHLFYIKNIEINNLLTSIDTV